MKKRLLTALTSTAVLLTSLVPLTVNAEEASADTFSLHDEYTFEEFIDLSDDEICALSDEIAQIYTSVTSEADLRSDRCHFSLHISRDKISSFTGGDDLSSLCQTLNLPDNALLTLEEYDGNDEIRYFGAVEPDWHMFTKYGDYEYIEKDWELKNEMSTKLVIWLAQHPAVTNIPSFELRAGNIAFPIKGDIDSDDTVTISDASGALGIYAKKAASLSIDEYTEEQLENADIDENGTVDLTDASAILSYYAKNGAGIKTYWATVLTEIAPISQ